MENAEITIPAKDQFQPNGEAVKMWLGTRKPTHQIAGMAAPGLLSDVDSAADGGKVILASFVEVVGLFAMIWGGIVNGVSYLFFAILIAFALVVLDYVFALLLHSREPVRCLCRAMLPYFDNNAANRNVLKREIEKGKWVHRGFCCVLALIAMLKLGGVFLLSVSSSPLIYAVFAVFYAIVVYVHINHTGYWWYHFKARSMIQKQYERLRDNPANEAQPHAYHVATPEPLSSPITTLIHYSVQAVPETDREYLITGKGLLSDRDIGDLIYNQKPQNKIALFRACRRLQFETVHLNEMPEDMQFPDEETGSSRVRAAGANS